MGSWSADHTQRSRPPQQPPGPPSTHFGRRHSIKPRVPAVDRETVETMKFAVIETHASMGDGYCCCSENSDTGLADTLSPSRVLKRLSIRGISYLGLCTKRTFLAEHSARVKQRHGVDGGDPKGDVRGVVIRVVLNHA